MRTVRDVRVEFVRPFGLPAFEDPGRNLAALESAARDLVAAVGDEGAGGLAPIDLRFLGTNLAAAAAVAADRETAPPVRGAPLTMRSLGGTGVFASVMRSYVTLARGAAARDGTSERDATALRRFADAVEGSVDGLSEIGAIAVRLDVADGVLRAPHGGGGSEMSLASVANFVGIDASAIAAIESQVESALERDLGVTGPDGAAARLDYTVRAAPPADERDRTLRLNVAFVGPQAQPSVPVSAISLTYVDGSGAPIADAAALGLPDPSAVVAATTVRLYRADEGGTAFLCDWGDAGAAVSCSLAPGAMPADTRLSVSALRAVSEGVLATLRSKDLMGVFVDVAGGQFDMGRGGIDVRGGATDVMLVAVPGIVDRVRVVAGGERVDPAATIDPPERRYERVRERSPFGAGNRVLRQSALEDYLHRASRVPNRRVDAAITPPPESAATDAAVRGTIGLDYLVRENRPWSIFVQGSNTGTGSTGEWQERFGLFHSDLLGNDEIVSIEYLTTDFDAMHAVNGYFDAPVLESEFLRWKVYGGWYEYNASDVGLGNERFEGSSPSVGAEIAANFLQRGELFVDAVAGARWFNVRINNLAIDLRGEEDFLVPYLGVRAQRNTRAATTDASVFLDVCVADATDVDAVQLNALGRLFPERDWRMLRWDLAQSFYLDPLFVSDAAEGTLAHELAFRVRGQFSFGNRLIPQQLGVAGGLYTVRGYPESIVSGDNLIVASAEYRLHLPQILGFDANPQPLLGVGEPFRLRPQFGYGTTDWDFILRAFVDVARVENVDRLSFERDESLIGAGVGVEFQLWRNLDLRLDLGVPLREIDGRELDSARLSFVGTLAF